MKTSISKKEQTLKGKEKKHKRFDKKQLKPHSFKVNYSYVWIIHCVVQGISYGTYIGNNRTYPILRDVGVLVLTTCCFAVTVFYLL